MDVEHIFDFNASLGKDQVETTIPSLPDCDQVIQELEKASKEGDLITLQRIFDEFRGTTAAEHWLKAPGSSLFFAVQNRRTAVVEYLLNHGVSLDINHIQAAIFNKDTALLELFLHYGWDINKAVEWAVPPPLA